MTSRRTFLITCGGAAAAPLAQLASAEAPASDAAAVAMTDAKTQSDLGLRVDGWDVESNAGNELWINVNSSWRAAWR